MSFSSLLCAFCYVVAILLLVLMCEIETNNNNNCSGGNDNGHSNPNGRNAIPSVSHRDESKEDESNEYVAANLSGRARNATEALEGTM